MTNAGISETDLYSWNMALIDGSLTVVQSGCCGKCLQNSYGSQWVKGPGRTEGFYSEPGWEITSLTRTSRYSSNTFRKALRSNAFVKVGEVHRLKGKIGRGHERTL